MDLRRGLVHEAAELDAQVVEIAVRTGCSWSSWMTGVIGMQWYSPISRPGDAPHWLPILTGSVVQQRNLLLERLSDPVPLTNRNYSVTINVTKWLL